LTFCFVDGDEPGPGWRDGEGGTVVNRRRNKKFRAVKQLENQRGEDNISNFEGNRSRKTDRDRLTLKSDPAPVRVRQMFPLPNNCWRWKRNQTKRFESDPKAHIPPYNLENPPWSDMLCKDFSQGGQC
jgi:hypothetical protein